MGKSSNFNISETVDETSSVSTSPIIPSSSMSLVGSDSSDFMVQKQMYHRRTFSLSFIGSFLVALSAFVVLLPVVFAQGAVLSPDAPKQFSVIDATDSDFDSLTIGQEAIVKLYAPWCGVCRIFAPHYEKVAEILAERRPHIRVIRINTVDNRGAVLRFLIRHVPSIFHISKDGLVREIDLAHNSETIVNAITPDALAKVVPWPAWSSPYSVFGRFRGFLGHYSGVLLDLSQSVLTFGRSLPTQALYGFLGVSFFLLIFGFFAMRRFACSICSKDDVSKNRRTTGKISASESSLKSSSVDPVATSVTKRATGGRIRRVNSKNVSGGDSTDDLDASLVEPTPRRSTRSAAKRNQ